MRPVAAKAPKARRSAAFRAFFIDPVSDANGSVAKLSGVLYLENNLAPRVFMPGRTGVLKMLASQAAIALENARLYRDVAEREARIRRVIDAKKNK